MHKHCENLPELFASQHFDVTTALLYLFAGGAMRLQVFVVEGDLNNDSSVRTSFLQNDVCTLICNVQKSDTEFIKNLNSKILV